MGSSRRFTIFLFVAVVAGAWLLIALLVRHNLHQIAGALKAAGWGVAAVVLYIG